MAGARQLQLETWWRRDKTSFQHWALVSYGPNDFLELTAGGVYGIAELPGRPDWSFNFPLVQGKILLTEARPNSWPGVALAVGAVPPVGTGAFKPTGWSGFAYLAATESLFDEERLIFHANLGTYVLEANDGARAAASITWGVASQLRVVGGFHLAGEVFSGDPYLTSSGGAMQGGVRYIFSDQLQLDASVGTGVFGETLLPIWATSGVRLVSHPL